VLTTLDQLHFRWRLF